MIELTVAACKNFMLHFHGFKNEDGLTGLNSLTGTSQPLHQGAGHGCSKGVGRWLRWWAGLSHVSVYRDGPVGFLPGELFLRQQELRLRKLLRPVVPKSEFDLALTRQLVAHAEIAGLGSGMSKNHCQT